MGKLMGAMLALAIACTGEIGGTGEVDPITDPNDPGFVRKELLDDATMTNLRRLSRSELDRVFASLLGTSERIATRLLPEDDHEREGLFLHWPFDNRYTHQPTNRVLVQAYDNLAQEVASAAMADADQRAEIIGCEPTASTDADCFERFLRSFGRRAYRRPMQDDEVTRMMPLLDEGAVSNDFDAAVELALRAFLQAPDFLYRVEPGEPLGNGARQLDDFAIATRLALFLWGTTPNDWLLDQAEAGNLRDATSRRAIADEMLRDPHAIDQVEHFHAQWLGFVQLPHDPELTTSMRLETRALLERVIFEDDLPYVEVFLSDETYVDAMLAEHYGMATPTRAEFVRYEDPRRAGLLAHGSLMGALSTGGDTNTTRRGVFVRERLMCQTIPPPPPTVNVDDVPETHCKSEFLEAHQQGGCGGCHAMMDPIGWGLENFDLAGRTRDHDDGKPECTIDGEGRVDDTPFSGPRELAELLIDGGTLEPCIVRQVMRFAMGREEHVDDEQFIAELSESRRDGRWTFRELLLDIASNERFAIAREDMHDPEGEAP